MRKLKDFIKKRGFKTQEEFANALGITQQNVSLILNGKRKNTRLTTAIKMCEVLNITLEELAKLMGLK